jgi:N-acetylneuraminic acid mutarotase
MVSITQTLENWTLPRRIWKTGASLPRPLLESASFAVGDTLYVFGGFTFKWQAAKDVYVYSLKSNQWLQLNDMPTPVTHINTAVDGSTVWFAGGFVGNHPGVATNEVWQYSVETDQWFAKTPLPQKRAGGALGIINRELHYFGGFAEDRDTTCTEHWYLPLEGDGAWLEAEPLPSPTGHISGLVFENKIYAIGGQYRHDTNPVDKASLYCFDGLSKQWLELASMPEPRSHFEAATFRIDDYIFILGGRNNQNPVLMSQGLLDHVNEKLIDDLPLQLFLNLKSKPYYTDLLPNILAYKISKNIWTDLASLPTRLYGPVANMLGYCLVVTGGSRLRHRNVQTRTLLNETLIDLIELP